MKKKNVLWSLLTVILISLFSISFVSCSDDDDDDNTSKSSTIIVTNKTGSYSFYSFTFVFKNRNDETISTKECGTILNNDKATGTLPAGCSYYYFGFYVGSYMVISPNYYVEDSGTRKIDVTYEMVNSWDVYDTSSAPRKIGEVR